MGGSAPTIFPGPAEVHCFSQNALPLHRAKAYEKKIMYRNSRRHRFLNAVIARYRKIAGRRVLIPSRRARTRQAGSTLRWLLSRPNRAVMLLGAVLTLALGVAVICATFLGIVPPATITGAFILLLGFFFGSHTTR